MSKSKIISAIELGSSKIATLIAQVQFDEVTFEPSVNVVGVSSVDSRGIKKGQIVDIDEAVEATISSVEAAERMAGYNLDSAYIAIGGGHVQSQNSHGVVAVSDPNGEISEADVDRVVEAASAVSIPSSREVIHVVPREFIVDGESGVKVPIGMSGVRLEVETHLVTASNASIKNLSKAVNEVGVEIDGLVFSAIAASEAVLTKTEKELGCVLVDIGGGTTSLVSYVDGSIAFSSVIPIGSKNVTNDLAIGLRVSLDSAEQIKKMLSSVHDKSKKGAFQSIKLNLSKLGVDSAKKVSEKTLTEGIIKPRLNEIFTMVKIALDRESMLSKVPSGVILTGGGAEVVGAQLSAKRMLGLPVRIGKPKGVKGLVDEIIKPTFAVPVGLLMYGLKESPQSSGFGRKLRLPKVGAAGRLFEKVKDLLP
ncbi:cell division protein FtsA [Patescibacteria group bacterium]